MSQTVVVDGIERQGWAGLCVECSGCKTVYNGGNGVDKPGPIRTYRGHDEQTLVRDAKAIGWTGDLTRSSENDLCPKCTKSKAAQ